ncbi:hypothetical protein HPP92_010099 [Vanilla planifolia]|uniref:COBRA C-terminal domain-containing protein n=1 Tax=Vanilla planifolia TaxID=51239 RepID=A0A835QT99_VANPL|nr:hypothetical protein HPP92_010099 [Vanilla planifolia]
MDARRVHLLHQGAYTLLKDSTDCVYGEAGNYYGDLDFSKVANCQKRPILVDLPPEREKDSELGNIPYCCKNGTLLPPTMDPSRSKAVFQIQVFKLPPDLNRTALYPPQKWKITGVLNPDYKCGAPIRVSPTEFPDQSGLMAESLALASWQVVCNMTKDKPKHALLRLLLRLLQRLCCSLQYLRLRALLVPFTNRSAKAKAWARIKHLPLPNRAPCGDNCGISVNWHLYSDYKNGWTARITLFNWEDYTFRDWFAAIQMKKSISAGYENVYSFNGTKMNDTYWPGLGNLVFMQGLPGLNYLMPEVDGKNPWDQGYLESSNLSSPSRRRRRRGSTSVPETGFQRRFSSTARSAHSLMRFPLQMDTFHSLFPKLVFCLGH